MKRYEKFKKFHEPKFPQKIVSRSDSSLDSIGKLKFGYVGYLGPFRNMKLQSKIFDFSFPPPSYFKNNDSSLDSLISSMKMD